MQFKFETAGVYMAVYNLKKHPKKLPVFGEGINDVEYNVNLTAGVGGKRKILWRCPYYSDWRSMLERCFCPKYHEKHPTYRNCTVDKDWLYLSNFIKWVDSQPNRDWQNCALDKDLLFEGNKHYSPDNVVYITKSVNSFLVDSSTRRGCYLIGVSQNPKSKINPYKAKCSNALTGQNEYLGTFPTEIEAHRAWQAKKHEHALRLAEEQHDHRVARVLRERYAPDKDWTNK